MVPFLHGPPTGQSGECAGTQTAPREQTPFHRCQLAVSEAANQYGGLNPAGDIQQGVQRDKTSPPGSEERKLLVVAVAGGGEKG